jgi:predicted RNA-binding protein with PUA-like domain
MPRKAASAKGEEGPPADHPAGWLFKEEPEHYNYADLERDGRTVWDGVTNNLAMQNLRKVRRGDRVLYYHTGKEKAVVGEMRVVTGPQPDPQDPSGKRVVVEVQAVRRLAAPVSLAQIKEDPELQDWELVRLPRLSVVPVSKAQWQRIAQLSRTQA